MRSVGLEFGKKKQRFKVLTLRYSLIDDALLQF